MNLRYKTISFFCLYEFRGNIFQFSSLFWLLVMSSILISLSFSHKRWRYKSYYVWIYHLVTCTEERRSVSPYRFPLLRTGSRSSSRPTTPKISRPTTPNPSRPTTPNPSNARQRVSNVNHGCFLSMSPINSVVSLTASPFMFPPVPFRAAQIIFNAIICRKRPWQRHRTIP